MAATVTTGAFGEPAHVSNTGGVPSDVLGWAFSTKPADPDTGHAYFGYRWYNRTLGRWLSRDPIEEHGGLNLYGMVGNEPVGRWDWLGLCTDRIWALESEINELERRRYGVGRLIQERMARNRQITEETLSTEVDEALGLGGAVVSAIPLIVSGGQDPWSWGGMAFSAVGVQRAGAARAGILEGSAERLNELNALFGAQEDMIRHIEVLRVRVAAMRREDGCGCNNS